MLSNDKTRKTADKFKFVDKNPNTFISNNFSPVTLNYSIFQSIKNQGNRHQRRKNLKNDY